MAMIKTDKARMALRDRASLSVQERQILILSDGRRSRQEIASWLGDTAWTLMDALLAQGYLAVQDERLREVRAQPGRRAAPTAVVPGQGGGIPRAASRAWGQAAVSPLAVSPRPARRADVSVGEERSPPPAEKQAEAKRSLAACKMYALGILQMQRSGEAQTLVARLQRSSDEAALLAGVSEMLLFLKQATNTSYAQSVQQHIHHLLPEAQLATLRGRMEGIMA